MNVVDEYDTFQNELDTTRLSLFNAQPIVQTRRLRATPVLVLRSTRPLTPGSDHSTNVHSKA